MVYLWSSQSFNLFSSCIEFFFLNRGVSDSIKALRYKTPQGFHATDSHIVPLLYLEIHVCRQSRWFLVAAFTIPGDLAFQEIEQETYGIFSDQDTISRLCLGSSLQFQQRLLSGFLFLAPFSAETLENIPISFPTISALSELSIEGGKRKREQNFTSSLLS